jgi:hypothetical protein
MDPPAGWFSTQPSPESEIQALSSPAKMRGFMSAVSLFKRYGNGGDNTKLKTWAATTLPALQHHLDMAQGLYKNT